MRPPSLQSRLLAFPPVYFAIWCFALWTLYVFLQNSEAWPLVLGASILGLAASKADQEVRAWKAWEREWHAVSGTQPRRLSWLMPISSVLGLLLFCVLASAGQQGGTQAVVGVLMVLLGPLVLLGLLSKLWGWVRRRHHGAAAKVRPVTVCVTRALIPVPPLRDAYRGLPNHCLAVMQSDA